MIVNVLPTFAVADFDAAVAWYERFFGRPPDRRPMEGLAEWKLTEGGGIQVFHNAEGAATTSVTIGVDNVDAHVTELAGRGIRAEAFDTSSGQFRVATIEDPEGNTITVAQELGVAGVR